MLTSSIPLFLLFFFFCSICKLSFCKYCFLRRSIFTKCNWLLFLNYILVNIFFLFGEGVFNFKFYSIVFFFFSLKCRPTYFLYEIKN